MFLTRLFSNGLENRRVLCCLTITSTADWSGWLAEEAHELLKGKLYFVVGSSRRSLIVPSKPLRGRMLSVELFPLSFRRDFDF